jgi:23S rRNA (guanosine2251-2'-O)-methyltransferase
MCPVGSRYSKSDSPAPGRARRAAPGAAPAAGRGPARRPEGRPPAASRGRAPDADPQSDAPRDQDLIYGRNAVREALLGKRRVHTVLLGTGDAGDSEAGLELTVREWCAEAKIANLPIAYLPYRDLTARLRTPDHQGVAAEVEPYPYADPEQLLAERTLIVALDEVQDPRNLGAIIRTAEATGAGVVITRHRAAEITGTVVKASAGATEHAAVAQVRNLSDFLSIAKERGFWVYGAEADSQSDYSAQDYKYPTCFVLGSEGQGVGRRVATLCDVMVSLPLVGQVESLNVSVSAGVLLYEAVRQRRSGEQ